VDPTDGRQLVIEMNPRVSRSSALASKATGFPIAKIAARLAVGYRLDEVTNDITGATPASFEPTIDYVVTKIPRWAFEKLPGATDALGTRMQSVGEVMAIGRTFPESLQKAIRGLELGRAGLNCDAGEERFDNLGVAELIQRAKVASPDRPFELESCLRRGVSVDELADATGIDPWFLDGLAAIVDERARLEALALGSTRGLEALTRADWRRAKRLGFSDAQIARVFAVLEGDVRAARLAAGVRPTFKTVDTCAAEFAALTPYYYSTYEDEDEVRPAERPRIVILGSGPNRIGQGIEFDYSCVHASMALRAAGYETVMVNCNPETVSTDYDTSDRLYFEPVTEEAVLDILAAEEGAGAGGVAGVIVSLGGQTPLRLAGRLRWHRWLGRRTGSRHARLRDGRQHVAHLTAALHVVDPHQATAERDAQRGGSQGGRSPLVELETEDDAEKGLVRGREEQGVAVGGQSVRGPQEGERLLGRLAQVEPGIEDDPAGAQSDCPSPGRSLEERGLDLSHQVGIDRVGVRYPGREADVGGDHGRPVLGGCQEVVGVGEPADVVADHSTLGVAGPGHRGPPGVDRDRHVEAFAQGGNRRHHALELLDLGDLGPRTCLHATHVEQVGTVADQLVGTPQKGVEGEGGALVVEGVRRAVEHAHDEGAVGHVYLAVAEGEGGRQHGREATPARRAPALVPTQAAAPEEPPTARAHERCSASLVPACRRAIGTQAGLTGRSEQAGQNKRVRTGG